MSKETKIEEIPAVDHGNAPQILVDGYTGSSSINGVARFAFYAVLFDAESKQNQRVVNLHLSMPVPTMIAVHQALGELLEHLKKSGMIQQMPASDQKAH